MHSLSRCAHRSWTLTSATTCQAFSTCRPSMGDTQRTLLPYQSVGWLSVDLKNVKHQPWMNVMQATFGEDERDRKRQRRREREMEQAEQTDVEGSRLSNEEKSEPPPWRPPKPAKPRTTAMSGALTMAKSSWGVRRDIARDLLPSLTNGLPPPPARTDYTRRAKRFVPIPNTSMTSPSEDAQQPSGSRYSRQSRHPQSIYARDDSLEEYFDDRSRRDLPLPYVDTDEYALISKSRRAPEHVSGMPVDEWRRSTEEMLGWSGNDESEEGDLYGSDNRPDFISLDPSRLPRVGNLPHLPKAADIVLDSSKNMGSGRLWRSPPIILTQTQLNPRRPL
ncbi:hypothetical protein JB92DRAFT_1478693 [Gautieria morchelliformis]|nr:hypothetical protein JB92DRAFT_1478693 [Gautieria morchelliformis]